MSVLFGSNDLLRWGSAFVTVVGVHLGLLWIAVNGAASFPAKQGAPIAAMTIEWAAPAAGEAPPVTAPSRDPELIEPLPKLPESESEPASAESISPAAQLEPIERKDRQPSDVLPEDQEPPPRERAALSNQTAAALSSQTAAALSNQTAAAPRHQRVKQSQKQSRKQNAASNTKPVDATLRWQLALLSHLEHHKRYPRVSRRKKQEAVVYVRVQINRQGRVIDYRLQRRSLYQPLNQESLALIARAQPLPPPPETVRGESLELVVPVEFFLRP